MSQKYSDITYALQFGRPVKPVRLHGGNVCKHKMEALPCRLSFIATFINTALIFYENGT